MCQDLVNWLIQVQMENLLPKILWLVMNIIDCFLTKFIVPGDELQLVSITAIFIAAKYEECQVHSVKMFTIFETCTPCSKKDIFRQEMIILQTLEFKISHYCSLYRWMQKINWAGNYNIRMRRLGKFFMEITLLDWRFLGHKPSPITPFSMFTTRKILGKSWVSFLVSFPVYLVSLRILHHLFVTDSGFQDLLWLLRGLSPAWLSATC